MAIAVIVRPVAGSRLVLVNYLFGLIFLPLLDCELLRNRNCLTHFRVSHRPRSSHCGLSGSICEISAGPLTQPHPLLSISFLLLLPDPRKVPGGKLAHRQITVSPSGRPSPTPHRSLPIRAGSSHLKGVLPPHRGVACLGTGIESGIIQESTSLWSGESPAPQAQRGQERLISRRHAAEHTNSQNCPPKAKTALR